MNSFVPELEYSFQALTSFIRPVLARFVTEHKDDCPRPASPENWEMTAEEASTRADNKSRLSPSITTREDVILALPALAWGSLTGTFGVDNLDYDVVHLSVPGVNWDAPERHALVLQYPSALALLVDWVRGRHSDVCFEHRVIAGESIDPKLIGRALPRVASDPAHRPRADCLDERLKLAFGIYGPHRQPGVLSTDTNGVSCVIYDTYEDMVAEWRRGLHPDIPFLRRMSRRDPLDIYRWLAFRRREYYVRPSDYPQAPALTTALPSAPTEALQRLFGSEVHNHIGKPWYYAKGDWHCTDAALGDRKGKRRAREEIHYVNEEAKMHDWLLGVDRHIGWAQRVVVGDEQGERIVRKRKRREARWEDDEAEEEERAAKRTRTQTNEAIPRLVRFNARIRDAASSFETPTHLYAELSAPGVPGTRKRARPAEGILASDDRPRKRVRRSVKFAPLPEGTTGRKPRPISRRARLRELEMSGFV
ncbi:hypothetical protein MKEN_01119300 [Mycena kentingensis (nom. inval.)]|nr:hypothetical protein MKEN_01119300 [Mycena kentingensis (nom. inval.)]